MIQPGRKRCSVVVPLFNEQEAIGQFHGLLTKALSSIGYDSEIIYVDDGSTDETLARLRQIAAGSPQVRVLSLSRNFGHQAAFTAGLDHARGDVVITMDGDGEHPPQLIPRMITLYEAGFDIVWTKRTNPQLGRGKRVFSMLYYRLINRIGDTEMPEGAADFRLLSRQVVDCLIQMPERHRFLRGLTGWIGFKSVILPYETEPRIAGEPKYTLGRSWRLARDGIFSFSTVPLKLAFATGGLVLLVALAQLCFVAWVILTEGLGTLVPGWTSLMLGILVLGGIQLVMLGLQGYYIGMIFQEVRKRPIYLIREEVTSADKTEARRDNTAGNG